MVSFFYLYWLVGYLPEPANAMRQKCPEHFTLATSMLLAFGSRAVQNGYPAVLWDSFSWSRRGEAHEEPNKHLLCFVLRTVALQRPKVFLTPLSLCEVGEFEYSPLVGQPRSHLIQAKGLP